MDILRLERAEVAKRRESARAAPLKARSFRWMRSGSSWTSTRDIGMSRKEEKAAREARYEIFARIYDEVTDRERRNETLMTLLERQEQAVWADIRAQGDRGEIAKQAVLHKRTLRDEQEVVLGEMLALHRREYELKISIAGILPSDIWRALRDRGMHVSLEDVQNVIFKPFTPTAENRDLNFARLRHYFTRNAQDFGHELTDREVQWVLQALSIKVKLRDDVTSVAAVHALKAKQRKVLDSSKKRKKVDPLADWLTVDGDVEWVQAASDWIDQKKIARKDFIAVLDDLELCVDEAEIKQAMDAIKAGDRAADTYTRRFDFATPVIDRAIMEERRLNNTDSTLRLAQELLACHDCASSKSYLDERRKVLRQQALCGADCVASTRTEPARLVFDDDE